jgi:hypothetical protein
VRRLRHASPSGAKCRKEFETFGREFHGIISGKEVLWPLSYGGDETSFDEAEMASRRCPEQPA